MADPVDWNALAADVLANHQATGRWFASGSPVPPEPVDWSALAARVQANFAATGQWFLGEAGRTIALVSTDAQGRQLNAGSLDPRISEDARYVTFITYGEFQFYRKDLQTGELALVSANAEGVVGNGRSGIPVEYDMTPDGRHVAFNSQATNLVPGDGNGSISDVFVKDMRTSAVTLASTDAQGRAGDRDSSGGPVSNDGRHVAFVSSARNFMPGEAGPPRENAATTDIYVKDLETGRLTLASADAAGHQGTGPGSAYFGTSTAPSISGDGSKVAFTSYATNLVPNDTNDEPDVFVKDLRSGEVVRVSTDSDGRQVSGWNASQTSISDDGRYVAFGSISPDLVPGDTNGTGDVFLKDTQTGALTLVSATPQGFPGNAASGGAMVSGNGRHVAFRSGASDLVPGDTNGQTDIFLKDLATGETRLVSQAPRGGPGNGSAGDARVTNDGEVAFSSASTNLVPGDTNGQYDIFLWA